jgi:hypothetical protein
VERAALPGQRQGDPVQVPAPAGPQLRVVQVAALYADAARMRAIHRGIDVYREAGGERDRAARHQWFLGGDEVTHGSF